MNDQNDEWERYPVPQCPECNSEEVIAITVEYEGNHRELDESICLDCEHTALSDDRSWFKRRMRSLGTRQRKEDVG